MAGAQRGWPQTLLRISPELKEWLKSQSEQNFSSINSEVLRCVQERKDRQAALEARRKAATGDGLQSKAPAAVRKTGARQGASLITQG